jgi:hypothetical protein
MASPAAPDSSQFRKLQRRREGENVKSKQFLFCTEAVQKNKVSKPQRPSTVLELLQRLVGQQCRPDGLSSSTRQLAVFQAAEGRKKEKVSNFLFCTEPVYKNKVSKMQERAPYSRFCRDLLVSSAAPMASPAAPDRPQRRNLQ